jgi:hypothetical protein
LHVLKQAGAVGDEETQAMLAEHACMLASGQLELSVPGDLSRFSSDKAYEAVAAYACLDLEQFTNTNSIRSWNVLRSQRNPRLFQASVDTQIRPLIDI